MKRLTRVFAETTHGTKGYESVNEINVDTESIHSLSEVIVTLGVLEDILEKYGIKSANELDKFIHHKDCQIDKWKQYYENCSKLEKHMTKEHQYCLDNWRAAEQELAELKQKAIVPKYQVGQSLFRIDFDAIVPFVVNEIYVHIKVDKTISIQYFDYVGLVFEENELFATREEAEQKLAEIGGKDESSKLGDIDAN